MWFCATLEDLEQGPVLNKVNYSLKLLQKSLSENSITMWDNLWDVSADSRYWEQFFQGKQDHNSEADCSELEDLLWEVLHYLAKHKLFIHLTALVKTYCSIYWPHTSLLLCRRSLFVVSLRVRPWNPKDYLGGCLHVLLQLQDLIWMRRSSLHRMLCSTPWNLIALLQTLAAILLWFLFEQNSHCTVSL